MSLIKEINEAMELKDLQSGFQKSPKSIQSAKAVADGKETVILSNGKEYKATKRLAGNALKKGMIVLARYNSFNQGVDICKIIGVTGDDKAYGEGGVKFNSVRECLNHYDVKSVKELEKLQEENEYGFQSYLFVEDMEDVEDTKNQRGPWYYIDEGRWCRGSGAEKLSFTLLEEV